VARRGRREGAGAGVERRASRTRRRGEDEECRGQMPLASRRSTRMQIGQPKQVCRNKRRGRRTRPRTRTRPRSSLPRTGTSPRKRSGRLGTAKILLVPVIGTERMARPDRTVQTAQTASRRPPDPSRKTNQRTNEPTNQRTNEPTNQRTNEPTNRNIYITIQLGQERLPPTVTALRPIHQTRTTLGRRRRRPGTLAGPESPSFECAGTSCPCRTAREVIRARHKTWGRTA